MTFDLVLIRPDGMPFKVRATWQPMFFLDRRTVALVTVRDCAECGGQHEGRPLLSVPIDALDEVIAGLRAAAADAAAVDQGSLDEAITTARGALAVQAVRTAGEG